MKEAHTTGPPRHRWLPILEVTHRKNRISWVYTSTRSQYASVSHYCGGPSSLDNQPPEIMPLAADPSVENAHQRSCTDWALCNAMFVLHYILLKNKTQNIQRDFTFTFGVERGCCF